MGGRLHTFSDWSNPPEGQHWSNWTSVEVLSLYLKTLLGTLNNQSFCSFCWENYLQLRQGQSNSAGFQIIATDWPYVLDELLLKAKSWPDTTSTLIFMNLRPDFTFGEYAEVGDLLDNHLAGRYLLSISSTNPSQAETTLLALTIGTNATSPS